MTVIFGDPRMPKRFWSKIAVTDRGCWEMGKMPDAYAMFWFDGKLHGAHRVAWKQLVGPVDDDLDIDHVCRNKPCCNPAHLEPVTRRTNIQRAFTPLPAVAQRTHCSSGHELTADNVLESRATYKRCKACRVEQITAKTLRAIDDDDWLSFLDD